MGTELESEESNLDLLCQKQTGCRYPNLHGGTRKASTPTRIRTRATQLRKLVLFR
jgi:hypothetical protein